MNATVLAPPIAAEPFDGLTAREFIELWDALASTGHRFELDHGTIIRMPPPKSDHSDIQSDFFLMLAPVVRLAGDLRANVELGVVVSNDTVRVPDIVVRSPGVDEFRLVQPGAARLVVEIADRSLLKDLGVKSSDYAIAGIGEYWVVDVTARVVHMHSEPTPQGYAKRSVVSFGQPMHAACLPEPVIFEG